MPRPPDEDDDTSGLAAHLRRLTAREALAHLQDPNLSLDWSSLPTGVRSADGARLRFDRRRRSVEVRSTSGELWVVDLGRRDRMRDREDVLTADLERIQGPVLEVTERAEWSMGRGDVAVRDLRTTSGLGCFHDGRRTGFMRAVTPTSSSRRGGRASRR
ncbi:hypothetical protein GCM10027517_16990 [Phycicoccus ginsengisoli]